MKLSTYRQLIWLTIKDWLEDKAPRLGAALAFYSTLSLGPLLLIVISIAGIAVGYEAASERILLQLSGLVGDEGAQVLRTVLENSAKEETSFFAAAIGIAALLLGATGVFGQLQDALNTIWEVKAKPGRGLWWIIRKRFLSFALVLGTGFLLLISLVLSAALSAVGGYFFQEDSLWMQLANSAFSFAVITVLFAMIFKILPDVIIQWKDVWIGAVITAVLFSIGKLAIGTYLGHSALSSVYGASGSLIVLLLWVYYSAQILFFGAEFTQVYARYHGATIRPARGAIPLTEEARNQQGMT
jgi:membrane protein